MELPKIYDFSKNTLAYIDHAKKQYVETSLYAIPAFKDFEKKNREMLAKVAGLANIKALQTDPFYIESIFGDDPKSEAGQKIQIQEENGITKFSYNGEEVVAYDLSDHAIKSGLKGSYKKYLIYEHNIHPVIWGNVSGKGTLFKTLSYSNKQEMPALTESSFSASAYTDAPTSTITIPDGYQINYAPDEALDRIIKLSMNKEPKSVDDYLADMNALLDQKQYMEASLVFHEYTIQTGGKDIEKIKGTLQRIFSEAPPEQGVQQLTAAISQAPSSKEQLQKQIDILQTAKDKNFSHGYVLNVFLANYLDMAGQTKKARDLILEALEKNPFLTGAYKDLGDKYMRGYDMTNAWASWDQMRKINTEHQLVPAIANFEQQLKQKHPVYFQ